MAVYLAPISHGLGDLLVSLPAIQALIKSGEPTYLVMRSPYQEGLSERIAGLAGSIREVDLQLDDLGKDDKVFNLRDHPLQTDYIWGSEEFESKYPGYKINDVLKGVCADFGIDADFEHCSPLTFNKRPEVEGKIAFIPGSAGAVKCWPAEHWLKLAALFEERGMDCFVIGQPERSEVVNQVLQKGLKHVVTPKAVDALDVLSSSRCAIGVDTGLMHMAVNQGVPTVGLFRYNVMFVRPYEHFRCLPAPVCPQSCIDREYHDVENAIVTYDGFPSENTFVYWKTWSCAQSEGEQCMWKVTPDMVLKAVESLLGAVRK